MATIYKSADELARAIVEQVGPTIVLGLPIGIGKATHVTNALFDLAADDPSLSLTIFTGLTLETPVASSDTEKRFLQPLLERLYPDWPTPQYAEAIRAGTMPANIEVHEFYLRPGAYLRNNYVQQRYANINYSQVAGELERLGVNVVAQLVAESPNRPGRYSLGSNPEVTLDLVPWFEKRRSKGLAALVVGQINPNMPYMLGDADVDANEIDLVLDDDDAKHKLFGLPNRKVVDGDYATAMHVASLVRDGGTIQIGIGSLSDAVAHCLKLRHNDPALFAEILEQLPGGTSTDRRKLLPVETASFEQGLYASTELLSDALYALFEADIVKRPADAETDVVMHAGFFIGSSALYEGLSAMPAERRRLIDMTRISFVNTLFGDERRKRMQRRDARFINETMMVTLLGAAVSDALNEGRVVSGVGGQFDFVSMAQSLDDAMSILMCRARRVHGGTVSSNIRWQYEHTTVPRHHRDIYVTEYGVAATRGLSDRDIVDSILKIADAAFHDGLVASARAAGKLEHGYAMSEDSRRNTPDNLKAVFDRYRSHFPAYPLGSALTDDEAALVDALGWLQTATATTSGKLRSVAQALLKPVEDRHAGPLDRMGLARPAGISQTITARLLSLALARTET